MLLLFRSAKPSAMFPSGLAEVFSGIAAYAEPVFLHSVVSKIRSLRVAKMIGSVRRPLCNLVGCIEIAPPGNTGQSGVHRQGY
jgi:hypothetical protein